MANVNWENIRNEFENTPATLKELAEKYNISEGTVRSRKCREKWEKKGEEKPDKKTVSPKKKPATQRKKQQKKKKVQPKKKSATLQSKKAKTKKEDIIEDVVIENDDLTEKQRLFCLYYIKNFNATQAAIKAGYTEKYPSEIGYQLLQNSTVRAEIQRLKELKRKSIFITEDDIVERYMRIAFADITDFVEFGTKEEPIITEDGPLKDTNDNPITETVNYINFKGSEQVDGGLICEISKGKQGIKIKLEDRQKALDWLANYFEMNPMDKHKVAFDKAKLRLEEEKVKLQRELLEKDKPPENKRVVIVDDIK